MNARSGRGSTALAEVVDDRPSHRPQGVLLVRVEDVEDEVSDLRDMAGCGVLEMGQPLLGQDRVGVAAVAGIGFAAVAEGGQEPVQRQSTHDTSRTPSTGRRRRPDAATASTVSTIST